MADKTSVAPMDPNKKNSPLSGPTEGESTVVLDSAANKCYWNGHEFAEGAMVESEGHVYECAYGRWIRSS